MATAPAQTAATSGTNGARIEAQAPPSTLPEFYIREYRVLGAHHLQPVEIENAVYPYLGPGRTTQDVEHARSALLKAYEDKKISSVDVVVPPQSGAGGIVFLQVNELTVGRLRVHGSRFYDINDIKRHAPSLAEGQLVNFTDAQNDIVALNQLPDRHVTPVIRPGILPNTMDVDLNVKDTSPLHGSVEVNNRYSLDTPDLRAEASLNYDNLWQLGHSIGASVETSPKDTNKVAVFTGFFTLRFPQTDLLTITLQGTKQDSEVATLGDVNSVGNGFIIGLRTNFKFPTLGDYYQSLTFGIDYKALKQTLYASPTTPSALIPLFPSTPTTYVPLSLDYSGTWVDKDAITNLDLAVVFGIRGIGSDLSYIDLNRYKADSNFVYLHGFLSRTQDLPAGAQAFARVSGQVSDSPLLNSEEFSAGGLDTVRGYLESEVLGDDAALVNFELRTPSLLQWVPKLSKGDSKANEWRFYFFTDAAAVTIQDALPGQPERASLASFGGGTHMTIFDHFNGSLDLAVPLFNQNPTKAHHPFLTFRVWSDF
jgi:hemolysin activation/secretion protein